MAVKSAPALLKAIEGFRGETAGSKQHEGINSMLARVVDEVHKGSAPPQDSPGKREAASAASEAYQRNMGAEPGHDGGSGGPTSNKPGEARPGERPPDIAGTSGPSDHLSGAAPPPSRGNLISAASAPFPPSGASEIRRIAADREKSRPDTKFLEDQGQGDGNRDSNRPGPAAEKEGRIGDARAPSVPSPDMQSEGRRAAASSDTQPENTPPYAKEGLQGDGWEEARAKARKVLAKK